MKAIKLLQISVVAMFVLMLVVGVVVLFAYPMQMAAYVTLLQAVFPIFLAQVIPALIGSPLTELMRAKAATMAPTDQQPEAGK